MLIFYRALPPKSPNIAPKPPVNVVFIVSIAPGIVLVGSGFGIKMHSAIYMARHRNVTVVTVVNTNLNLDGSVVLRSAVFCFAAFGLGTFGFAVVGGILLLPQSDFISQVFILSLNFNANNLTTITIFIN